MHQKLKSCYDPKSIVKKIIKSVSCYERVMIKKTIAARNYLKIKSSHNTKIVGRPPQRKRALEHDLTVFFGMFFSYFFYGMLCQKYLLT